MKRNPFISRLATSVAAVALAIGSTFTLSSCSDDDEVDNSGSKPVTRLEAPVVAEVADEDITENSLTFTWAAVEEATHYSAQVRLSETGDIYRETLTANTTVSFEGLTDGTKYYFRVRANNTYNESRNSAYSEWTVVETVAADPTRPTLPTPANPMCDMSKTTVSSLTFSWESVEGATAYNVVLTTIGKDDVTATTTGTSYTFTGLEKGVKYYFTVQAAEIEGYNASKFSGVINARTTAQLETPTGLTCTVKMSEAAKFEWEAVENAATYAFELYKNADQEPVMAGMLDDLGGDLVPGETIYATSTANTSISFRGLERDTYYSLRVKAVPSGDAYLESGFTDYCVIKTLVTDATPLAAPALTIAEAQQLKATVTWTAVANALGYDYYYATADEIAAGDESVYVKGELRAIEADPAAGIEAGPCPTELVMKDLTPNTTYKLYVMTVADPANPTDGDSAYTELEVKTADLAANLTITEADDLAESIARMADGGTLTLASGEYATSGTVYFNRGVNIVAAVGATPVLKLSKGNFNVLSGAEISTIRFEGLTFVGKGTAGGGDHIFNCSALCTVERVEFVNSIARDYDRSFFRTQNKANVKNILIDNSQISIVAGSSQSYDVAQLDQSPETVEIKNTTFVNIAAFVRINNANAVSTKITVTQCTFAETRSGGQLFRLTGTYADCTMSKCVFGGAITKVGNNAASANYVTPSDNYSASDITWSSMGDHLTWATAETLSSAELFPNADGNYAPAVGSQAAIAGAGDPRWLK